MGWIEVHYVAGVFCDKPSCPERIHGRERGYFFREQYRKEAEAQGWTMWVGRSQRWYCPQHGPSNPSTMRKVTQS